MRKGQLAKLSAFTRESTGAPRLTRSATVPLPALSSSGCATSTSAVCIDEMLSGCCWHESGYGHGGEDGEGEGKELDWLRFVGQGLRRIVLEHRSKNGKKK